MSNTTPKLPATFEVVNTGKRARTRNGTRFPGRTRTQASEPVKVTVRNRAEWLRLKGCKDLKISPAKGGGASASASGGSDDLAKKTVAELDELLEAADLSTDGNKDAKVARLREHQEQQ